MIAKPVEIRRLNRKNIQYSVRLARPSNTAYFFKTSRYHCISISFVAAPGEPQQGDSQARPPFGFRPSRLYPPGRAGRKEIPPGELVHLAKEEGPIHIDLATKRLRQAWNLSRAGDRVREAVDWAAFVCAKLGELRRQGDFLCQRVQASLDDLREQGACVKRGGAIALRA
jgi:hypothetical protein